MKKAFILVLTNFFILMLILLGKPAKAQTTEITSQFLYGLQLYVLPEKSTTPDYSTAIYSRTIDENDFLTSGLYQNWLQPSLPDNINGYVYLVDTTHTIQNVYLGGGYLEQGQTLSYPYEPSIEMKHYNAPLITLFILNPVNKGYFETPALDYIVYYENNDGTTPRIKLIDATSNENDYNRVKLAINGYDTGYNAGYSIGYNNGQVNGYNSGYEEGQNNGYSSGYLKGQYDMYQECYPALYNQGYQQGLNDGATTQYATIQQFNQLIENGDFTDGTNGWDYAYYSSTMTVNDNVLNVKATTHEQVDVRKRNINIINTHKYFYSLYARGVVDYSTLQVRIPTANLIEQFDLTNSFIRYSGVGTANANGGSIDFLFSGSSTNIEIEVKNIYIIDLTTMYGEGHEPTAEQCNELFTLQYYPYNTGELLTINYLDGYNLGKNEGYDEGVSYQATQQLTSDGWIKNIFTGIGAFLGINILPGVSIGLIVGIPFIITVAWFVLKMARGGSSE